ncbi:0e3918d9-3e27-46d3-bdb0-55872fdcb9b6 [Sclerotinia trifoliorum]|uniref:0e3918d9-3e27-46d3-bdb0-55872fdcb9b6 n=1 Tax=Sclerotinia trifoliorum TaxID=28548 RepID=A0A8H2VVK5_9HELO|nr:0e3918d9-3e27-46d3-bdb0-55872fdcb9b6 [Sclerotinia trifoliorum]
MYILKALCHSILAMAFSDSVQIQAQLIFNPPLSEVELGQLHNISVPLSNSSMDIVNWSNALLPNSTVLDNSYEDSMQRQLLDVLSSIYNYITSKPDTINQVQNARNHPRDFKNTTGDMIAKSVGGLQPRGFSTNTTLQNGNATNLLHSFDAIINTSKEESSSQGTNTENTAAKKRSLIAGLLAGLVSLLVLLVVVVIKWDCCCIKGWKETSRECVHEKSIHEEPIHEEPFHTVYLVQQRRGSLPPEYKSESTLPELEVTYEEALRDSVPEYLQVIQQDRLNAMINWATVDLIRRSQPAQMPHIYDLHRLRNQPVSEGEYRARVELIRSLYSSMLPPQGVDVPQPVVEGIREVNPPANALERVATERLGTVELGTEQLATEHIATEQLSGSEQPGAEELATGEPGTELERNLSA